jgi:hypothetical protein
MPSNDPFPDRAEPPTRAGGSSGPAEQCRDLCSNCENAETHASRGRRPIFFCEEFGVPGAAQAPELARGVREPRMEMPRATGRLGLCVNCDHAETCCLPKPEGGVWHCEEYR